MPGLDVTSLADVAAPSLAGPCIEDGLAGVLSGRDGQPPQAIADDGSRRAVHPPASRWARALLTAIFKPYDRSAALLFYGAMGLVFMLALETGGAMAVLDQGFPDALYGSTKSLATVGPNTAGPEGPRLVQARDGRDDAADAAQRGVLHGRADRPAHRHAG